MHPRKVEQLVGEALARSPGALLVGPRQAGKTTLARSLGGAYFDLEQPSEQLRLDLEWAARVAGPELLLLDEAQCWPDGSPSSSSRPSS